MDLIKHYRQLVGIAKTWAEKNLPGWSDELHRDLLLRHGATEINGRTSASTLNLQQLGAVLTDYERRGWPRQRQYKTKGGAVKRVTPQIGLIVRLWGKLGQAGKIKNASRHTLLAFCARQVGHDVPNLDSLTLKEGQAIIEALKGMSAR